MDLNKILPYFELGMPCTLMGSPGRIVGTVGDSGEINGIEYYPIVIFATPSGIVIETGFLKLEEITGEGLSRLLEQEEIVKQAGDKPYNGLWT